MSAPQCHRCGSPIPGGAQRCPDCGASARTGRPAAFRFTTGEVIDNRYEVMSRIPGGGMGELYKVRHLHLHDVRAIKILRSDQMGDDNYRQRFLREARIAASIKHPNVALLHDFSTLPDKSFYMVEEFIDGTTLARCLRSGRRFSLNEIVEIARQALLGLGAIHDKGIIHRDISPDNIMLAESREGGIHVKIIDLGIARSVDTTEAHSITSAGLFIGKPHYASPEQMRLIEDDAPIDHRTDLYSLGVVLYEVVSGKVPFEASTPFEYLMKQLAGDDTSVDRCIADLVPPDLEKFIVRLLRAKREERFQSTVEALVALSKVRIGSATIQGVPLSDGANAYPASAPSKKRRQTAEVPIEQLRVLIQQDLPDSVRSPVSLSGQADAGLETAPREETDASRKVTIVQRTPPLPTHEVPRPETPPEETERTPLPTPEEPEPVAFLPSIPGQGAPQTIQPASEGSMDFHPAGVAPAPRSRRSQGPIMWFTAGIAFVAVVSVGGYLLYRWLDARFGAPANGAATTTAPMPSTTAGAGALPAETAPGQTAISEGATSIPEETVRGDSAQLRSPVERSGDSLASAPPKSAPPPPPIAPPTTRPTTSTPTAAAPAPAQGSPQALEPQPEAAGETQPTATETAATPQPPPTAPVTLPGATDDVREGDLVAPGPGVIAPVVTRTVEPIYPPLASNMGKEGVAMFSVLVGPDGKAEIVKLIVSSGSDPLDKSAEDAARQTVFEPATKNGIPVRMWKTLRFEFRKTRGF